jgi:hypothetical protein
MPKKEQPYMVDKADLKDMTRSEQRRHLDLGYVKGETPPAEVEAPKAKPAK